MAAEEVANQQNQAKELTQEHARWLLRFTNGHVPNHNDLIPIIAAAKAYKAKTEKGLRETGDKVQKAQDKAFELMRIRT